MGTTKKTVEDRLIDRLDGLFHLLSIPDHDWVVLSILELDDFQLASRLSFFLWGSIPDEPLLELAAQNKLRQPEVLRTQIHRMMNNHKLKRFADAHQGEYGRVVYDLKGQFGVDPDVLRERFAFYFEAFDL